MSPKSLKTFRIPKKQKNKNHTKKTNFPNQGTQSELLSSICCYVFFGFCCAKLSGRHKIIRTKSFFHEVASYYAVPLHKGVQHFFDMNPK